MVRIQPASAVVNIPRYENAAALEAPPDPHADGRLWPVGTIPIAPVTTIDGWARSRGTIDWIWTRQQFESNKADAAQAGEDDVCARSLAPETCFEEKDQPER